MKVKYIKVNTADRLPEKEGKYLCKVYGYSNYEHYAFIDGKFKTSFVIEEYLEPVPDREDEMREMLEECRVQLKFLNYKQKSILSRLKTLLES